MTASNSSTGISQRAADLAALYERAGLDGASGIIPTAAQWETLLRSPRQGKIYLLSFFVFSADPVAHMGEESLKIYEDIDRQFGSSHFFSGAIQGTFTGNEEAIDWKDFNIKEFPNLQALIDFMTDPRLLQMQKKRPGLVGKQRTIIVTPTE